MELSFIKENILKQYHFNLDFAVKSVEDVPQELMCIVPFKGLENHPAFTLGHLVTASAMTVDDLGGKSNIPERWNDLFVRNGPGDPRMPNEDSTLYPLKKTLLEELRRQHQQVETALKNSTDNFLLSPMKWRFNKYFPTTLDLVTFMCISHESMHLSQLSAWRRAMSLPSALAAL